MRMKKRRRPRRKRKKPNDLRQRLLSKEIQLLRLGQHKEKLRRRMLVFSMKSHLLRKQKSKSLLNPRCQNRFRKNQQLCPRRLRKKKNRRKRLCNQKSSRKQKLYNRLLKQQRKSQEKIQTFLARKITMLRSQSLQKLISRLHKQLSKKRRYKSRHHRNPQKR